MIFLYRQTEEGNFVAVPETIQLSPLDCDISQLIPQETFVQSTNKENPTEDLIKPDFASDDTVVPLKHEFLTGDNEEVEEYEYQDEIDIKPSNYYTFYCKIISFLNSEKRYDRKRC